MSVFPLRGAALLFYEETGKISPGFLPFGKSLPLRIMNILQLNGSGLDDQKIGLEMLWSDDPGQYVEILVRATVSSLDGLMAAKKCYVYRSDLIQFSDLCLGNEKGNAGVYSSNGSVMVRLERGNETTLDFDLNFIESSGEANWLSSFSGRGIPVYKVSGP